MLDATLRECDAPALIKAAKESYDWKISNNKHSREDWKNVIAKSKCLSLSKCQKCWHLLEKYEDVLQGKLSTFPSKPCKINLKPDSSLHCSYYYSIPHALNPLAKREIDHLVKHKVLHYV